MSARPDRELDALVRGLVLRHSGTSDLRITEGHARQAAPIVGARASASPSMCRARDRAAWYLAGRV